MAKAVDNLEFRGEDSEECNKFISAVLKYAFAEGKQRDDEWVADFVGTCFKGDALRWWMGLRPPIQGSWTLLRHAMTQKYRPSFYGRSGEEAEKFVHLVYERALDAGQQGDNRWIAEFVPTCFKGGALRWFASLDSTVRSDWGLLQEAIFSQYPSDDVSALSRYPVPPYFYLEAKEGFGHSVRMTPTPAAAGAPVNPEKPLKRGRVRIEYWGGDVWHACYLSRTLGPFGEVVCTQSKDDALQVECNPTCDDRQELVIPDIQVGLYDLLGMTVYDLDDDEGGPIITLCGVHSETFFTSSPRGTEEVLAYTKIWKIINDSASAYGEHATIVPTASKSESKLERSH